MNRLPMYIAALFLLLANVPLPGATIEGRVTDALGKPLENARIDHIGKGPVVNAGDPTIKPVPGDVRTDVAGHFQVSTGVPAFVVRKPGYESQRVRISGDADLRITLQRIKSTSRCELPEQPVFKTKESNDIDYVATWFYIETKEGKRGILSGSGLSYSWGRLATLVCGIRPSIPSSCTTAGSLTRRDIPRTESIGDSVASLEPRHTTINKLVRMPDDLIV